MGPLGTLSNLLFTILQSDLVFVAGRGNFYLSLLCSMSPPINGTLCDYSKLSEINVQYESYSEAYLKIFLLVCSGFIKYKFILTS